MAADMAVYFSLLYCQETRIRLFVEISKYASVRILYLKTVPLPDILLRVLDVHPRWPTELELSRNPFQSGDLLIVNTPYSVIYTPLYH